MSDFADYNLHAELIVTEENSEKFERLVREFVERGAFKRFVDSADWKFAFGLKTPEAYVYGNDQSPASRTSQFVDSDPLRGHRVYKYVNLWRILSPAGLDMAPIMVKSADDSLYIEIDSLVAIETQNLFARMHWIWESLDSPKVESDRFVRVTRRFFNAKDLAFYAYNVPVVRPLQERVGIKNLGYYQSVTGMLSTITEFWQSGTDRSLDATTLDYGARAAAPGDPRAKLAQEMQALRQRERHEVFRRVL